MATPVGYIDPWPEGSSDDPSAEHRQKTHTRGRHQPTDVVCPWKKDRSKETQCQKQELNKTRIALTVYAVVRLHRAHERYDMTTSNRRTLGASMGKANAKRTRKEWWILTGGFFRDDASRLYSGPYSTDHDAFTARVSLERLRGASDLWVDDRPAPEGSQIHNIKDGSE